MNVPTWLQGARDHWRWRGQARPEFAQVPRPGEESVWDYPRPPRAVPDAREVIIHWRGKEVARTHNALRVLETSHPPSFYLPWADVDASLVRAEPGSSFCEWKGPASYWSLEDGSARLAGVAWSYPQPLAGAEVFSDRVAFYPAQLECYVGGHRVTAQPGGFYGGWITPELVGPFKGVPGSGDW